MSRFGLRVNGMKGVLRTVSLHILLLNGDRWHRRPVSEFPFLLAFARVILRAKCE